MSQLKKTSTRKIENIASVLARDCFRLKKNERILILADKKSHELMETLLQHALKSTQAAFLVKIPEIQRKTDYLTKLLALVNGVDVLLIACDFRLGNTAQLSRLQKEGTRIAYVPCLDSIIRRRSLNINYRKLEMASKKLADIFSIGKNLELTNGNGTHAQMSIMKVKGASESGQIRTRGSFAVLPGGKAHIRPIPGTCNGLIVVDGSIEGVGLVNQPIRLQFKNGQLTRVVGNSSEAQVFRRRLRAISRPPNHLIRVGVGTNHNIRLWGNPFEDETALGRIHLGIGHLDQEQTGIENINYVRVSLRNADLNIDGRSVVRHGKVTI